MDINIAEMHNLVNIHFVDVQRTYSLLTVVHNRVKSNKFKMLNHDVNTRYNYGYKIDLIRPRNDKVRKSSLHVGTSLWNNLNLDV